MESTEFVVKFFDGQEFAVDAISATFARHAAIDMRRARGDVQYRELTVIRTRRTIAPNDTIIAPEGSSDGIGMLSNKELQDAINATHAMLHEYGSPFEIDSPSPYVMHLDLLTQLQAQRVTDELYRTDPGKEEAG